MQMNKNILYLNNYMSVNIAKSRNSQNIYSQPANNKIIGIKKSLEAVGAHVKVLSSGLVNSKSFKWYKRVEEKSNVINVVYCSIWDVPILSTMVSIIFMFLETRKENKIRPINNIIFYNYKPEVAWAAWLAKKILNIPITIEYEDGYSNIDSVKGFKRLLMRLTEKVVSKNISTAITVNSLLAKQQTVPCVVVRGVTDENLFLKREGHKKSERSRPIIFYGGGLDKERGIDILLDSLKYISNDFRLIITGKGKITVNDPRIDFKGFIDYESVIRYMLDADILIQSQLSQHQFGNSSFPSKIFEYMATGNLIISSEVADIKDFAGDAFYYYQNDDPKLLADVIKNSLENLDRLDMKLVAKKLSEDNLPRNIGEKIMRILT
ncbi:Glycosyltransferase involved in cell wall bisynthesis [Paenibacillus catalpae]|uniref:Glycosyltransferase involved in cell wall bisynthesis n=1 Tax=Paenibacillus catalpae TaxID=1045775 RepID=A0A1I2DU03_9BACL|nr:glycosyltransferase [Paenibacillus catalpae]SFE84006.1 Glycosyltransferase involved in cell wall bisynthesis [Paenibacillus catalpae]